MVTTFTRTVDRQHSTCLAVLVAILLSSLVALAPAAAATPASATAGCYASATAITRGFVGGTWTGWYSRTATASCADLNVAIMNHPSTSYMNLD